MQNSWWRCFLGLAWTGAVAIAVAQQPPQPAPASRPAWTWEQVKDRFEMNNPTLLAGKLNIDELKADEITAFFRPNPSFSMTADGVQIAPYHGVWQPFAGVLLTPGISYLHERRHKRELRRDSARKGTEIGRSQLSDQERNLLFSLRSAFVQILSAKAVLKVAQDNLEYYDNVLKISRDRFEAGDIAQIDLDRLELQRVQYESDVQTADVNVRTAKIQLLMLLNDRTPIEQMDVAGPFDFSEQVQPLDDYRHMALDSRPDLRAAIESVDKAQTDYKLAVADGSADPTFSIWYTHNGSFNNPDAFNTIGGNVSVPLRIFDRNQGQKLHTKIDITRNEKLRDATEAQVFSDVDSAYATLNSNVILLKPYRAKYLQQAVRVRDTVFFSYQHGGASLLDFLNAQSEYRAVELSYVNLVGAYLSAAAQLNQAVGREVMP
jgi:cobalt-zinc-cadmium efflux system outer membrane protein